MTINVLEILRFLDQIKINYNYYGNENSSIETFSSLSCIKDNSIIWVKNQLNIDLSKLNHCENLLVICENYFVNNHNSIVCEHSKEVFFKILHNFFYKCKIPQIYESAAIFTRNIGSNVNIGHGSFIGKEVIISDDVIIGNNVCIENNVIIGRGAIIHSGAVIGTDGFGFYKNANKENERVVHLGGVIIGRDVEIGANCCINRGTIDDTYIGNNVKIGSLVVIPHNVRIGDRTIILGTLGGNCIVGEDSYIAPFSYIKNQVKVGNKCMVNLNTVLTENLEDGLVAHGKKRYKVDYLKILNL